MEKSNDAENTYKVRVRRLSTTHTMESKLALLVIVGLLYAVHQTSAGESQYLLFRASAIIHEDPGSQEIGFRPSDPLNWSKESEVISVLPRPHLHFNEGGLFFRDDIEACVHVTYYMY